MKLSLAKANAHMRELKSYLFMVDSNGWCVPP